MTQRTPLVALFRRVLNADNSNQESGGTILQGVNKKCMVYTIVTLFTLLVISIIINVILPTIIDRSPQAACHFCPNDWIGFQDNCYYFSKQEGDWNLSRYNCFAHNADLTVIDTTEEMNFLRQHKCTFDHWIGLEMTKNQTGKWVHGTTFNKWFDVKGNGNCAYLSDDGAATARCYTERKWICRRKKCTN